MRALLLALALLLIGAPADAASAERGRYLYRTRIATATHPARAYNRLTTDGRRSVRMYLKAPNVRSVGKTTPGCSPRVSFCPSSMSPAGEGLPEGWACGTAEWLNLGTNVLNEVIWSWRQTMVWCWMEADPSVIVRADAVARGSTHGFWFWHYEAQPETRETSGGIGQAWYHEFNQGVLKLCVPFKDIDCFTEVHPWAWQTGWAGDWQEQDDGGY